MDYVVRRAAFRTGSICVLGLASALSVLPLSGCDLPRSKGPAVAVATSAPPAPTAQAALPGQQAALPANPLVALALGVPPAGDNAAWAAKYTFPAAGSISAGG